MCFRPKSRASMDQAPGPTIAKLAPRTASPIGMQESPGSEIAIHNSARVMTDPATGVHKPARRRIPAQPAMICGATNSGAAPR